MEWIDDWKNSQEYKRSNTSLDLKKILQRKSTSPLETLEYHLKVNLVYGVVIALIYIGIAIVFPHWTILIFTAVAGLFTIYTTVSGYNIYLKIKNWNTNEGVLPELKNIIDTFSSWLKITEKIGVFVYPFAISGGFILGGAFSINKSVSELFASNYTILALILCIIILTPVSYLLARFMNKKAFGAYLNRLNDFVKDVESE